MELSNRWLSTDKTVSTCGKAARPAGNRGRSVSSLELKALLTPLDCCNLLGMGLPNLRTEADGFSDIILGGRRLFEQIEVRD